MSEYHDRELADTREAAAVRAGTNHVRRVAVYLPSAELDTTIKRGIGFVGQVDGVDIGPIRRTYAEARKDARLHRLEASG